MGKSAEETHPVKAFGWAARDQSGLLSPFNFSRRETGDEDVRFKIMYCGICHTDLHRIKNEWGGSKYPMVPGHEIAGVVTEVGSKVQKYKIGDKVGVGCLHYMIRIPDNLPLDAAAPLLCAGITMYSPLRYFELDKPGLHVGVVGLGGLGHVGVKFAKALGAKVDYRDPDQMQAAMGTMDGILNTVSAVFPLVPLIGLLKSHGKLIMVGASEKPLELPVFPLLLGRKTVAGSVIGGLKETQEMIDFAGKHNITADIEVIRIDYANTAMERLVES
ncbi:hypothetical protein RHSIM_Rhsim06G0212600 [Rhododendron simsii]|uniref:Enoyl reductase (ER) domain-containing protein n=1 Tax=Rhododendron simsii TaxID=118357 RepID=A0A834LID8_RHOSS|nr:hypothetical protein RHSIM_Rhsim06G0212600 [Rhododendron simsii]